MRTGVEGCGVVVGFGKYTDIASLVLLFGCTTPAYIIWVGVNWIGLDWIGWNVGGGG